MYNYTAQLPNLNIHEYIPRTVQMNQLRQLDEITVDLAPLARADELGRVYLYAPEEYPSQIAASIWLSAVINLPRISKNLGDTRLLRDTEQDFVTSCLLRKKSDLSLLDCTKLLNHSIASHGYQFTLNKITKWDNVLLGLMEGYTVMIGGSVYSSFESAKTSGVVPMPQPGEDLLGGQIINLVSFNRSKDLALAIGNRGICEGKRGQFQYRGSYLRNLEICRDFFILFPRIANAND